MIRGRYRPEEIPARLRRGGERGHRRRVPLRCAPSSSHRTAFLMTAQDTNAAEPHIRLAHYPITFFAIGMGMMGLTLALRAAETTFAQAHAVSTAMLAVSVMLLGLVILGYAAKAMMYPAEVTAEWRHPVRIAFFPAASISLLLLATALLEVAPLLAEVVWIVATTLQGVLALSVISAWIGHRAFQPGMMTPAWFIPAVGNVIVPLAGAKLGYTEISWLFFSGGLIFWLVLLTLVVNRLMFHDPLPGRMLPTLMILVAPPAVALHRMAAAGRRVGAVRTFPAERGLCLCASGRDAGGQVPRHSFRAVVVGAVLPDCSPCHSQFRLCPCRRV